MNRVSVSPPAVSASPFKGKPCPPGRTKKRDQCIPKSELPGAGSTAVSEKPTETPEPVAESSPAEDYKKNGVRAKAFKAWFGDWESDPENSSKAINPDTGEPDETYPFSQVVDEEGEPIIVHHGTTHDFSEFDPAKAHELNHIGNGFYFSSDPGDSDANYAGEGPDLRMRVSNLAEQIEGALEGGYYEEWTDEDTYKDAEDNGDFRDLAEEIAREKLVGKNPHTKEVYLNIRKPVVLGNRDVRGTYFEISYPTIVDDDGNEDLDFDNPTGNGAQFIEALREAAEDYTTEGMDPIDIDELIPQLGLEDGVPAEKLVRNLFNSEQLTYAGKEDPNTGRFEYLQGQLLNDVFRKMGFDGVIYADAHDWFPNMVNHGTRHYIAFHPEQIKAVSNEGTFDPKNRNIFKRLATLRAAYKRAKEVRW